MHTALRLFTTHFSWEGVSVQAPPIFHSFSVFCFSFFFFAGHSTRSMLTRPCCCCCCCCYNDTTPPRRHTTIISAPDIGPSILNPPSSDAPLDTYQPPMLEELSPSESNEHNTVYVDADRGDDAMIGAGGSVEHPLKSIEAGISLARTLRTALDVRRTSSEERTLGEAESSRLPHQEATEG